MLKIPQMASSTKSKASQMQLCNCDTCRMIQPVVECPVCLENFMDPRVLACGHTLCYRCITHLAAPTRVLTCPSCRQVHPNFTTASALPRSLIASEAVGIANQAAITKAVQDFVACKECGKDFTIDDLMYCPEHAIYACLRCAINKHKPCSLNDAVEYGCQRIRKAQEQLRTVGTSITALRQKLAAARRLSRELMTFAQQHNAQVETFAEQAFEVDALVQQVGAEGDEAGLLVATGKFNDAAERLDELIYRVQAFVVPDNVERMLTSAMETSVKVPAVAAASHLPTAAGRRALSTAHAAAAAASWNQWQLGSPDHEPRSPSYSATSPQSLSSASPPPSGNSPGYSPISPTSPESRAIYNDAESPRSPSPTFSLERDRSRSPEGFDDHEAGSWGDSSRYKLSDDRFRRRLNAEAGGEFSGAGTSRFRQLRDAMIHPYSRPRTGRF